MASSLAETSSQFLYLALKRYQEAVVLLKARHWIGSLYLSGYVVECAMKAVLADANGGRLNPAMMVHDLVLLKRAVLPLLRAEDALIVQAVPPSWSHVLRYSCATPSAATVVQFLDRAKETYRCLSTYV